MKLACFSRARQKLTGRRLSKSRYSTNFQARFARREKSLVKNVCELKEKSFDLLFFEGKRVDFGANKPKLRRFEIRAFCDKMRPFCTISASTFWKIQPDIYWYIFRCGIYIFVAVYIFLVAVYIFLFAIYILLVSVYIFLVAIHIFLVAVYIFLVAVYTYFWLPYIYFWLPYIYSCTILSRLAPHRVNAYWFLFVQGQPYTNCICFRRLIKFQH